MTSTYKGLTFADHLAPFLPSMASLDDHREALRGLQGTWETLSLLGHLSSLRADMTETREAFEALTARLLGSLAEESLARVTSGLGTKAQFCIDILVRNLFERTADIGFLATDTAIVAACAADTPDAGALRSRFAEYVQRYSVYRDVILLGADGRVIARLKDGADGVSDTPLVRQALAQPGYVERYAVDTLTGAEPALSYASAVRDATGSARGVLVLVFDLAGEAEVVFDQLREGEELLAYLDADGRVLLSSDHHVLPPGLRLPDGRASARVRLGGGNHVAVQRQAVPYQGYAGPGWSAVALVPADVAFGQAVRHDALRFSGESVFSAELRAIPGEAARIQRRLERVVWNGRLQPLADADTASRNFSRALLEAIAATGRRTRDVFERSTAELLDTAAGSLLAEVRMRSALAVDILDRNLFERACDCRWWARDAVLQSLDGTRAAEVLKVINELYTVYTDILVFDRDGRVVASSAGAVEPGSPLAGDWVRACLGTSAPLGYAVSAFGATPLYGGRPSYVYSAPLRRDGATVGGVALVFDAEPQFRAMCEAALPQRAGAGAAYFRPDGSRLALAGALPMEPPAEALALAPGQSWSGFVARAGRCYAVGATAGRGYREFKTRDGYRETVVAFVVVPCGDVLADSAARHGRLEPVDGGREVATFDIGTQRYGVPADAALECIEIDQAVRVPSGFKVGAIGYARWRDTMLPLVDIGAQLGEAGAAGQQAVVLAAGGRHFGLVVAELGPIVALELADAPLAGSGGAGAPGRELVTQVGRSGSSIVPLLDPQAIARLAG